MDAALCQYPNQQDHLRVIRRLTGNGVPCAVISQFPHVTRVAATGLLRRLELDQAAEGIS